MVVSAAVSHGSDLVVRVANIGVNTLGHKHHAVVDVVLRVAVDAGVECQVLRSKRCLDRGVKGHAEVRESASEVVAHTFVIHVGDADGGIS